MTIGINSLKYSIFFRIEGIRIKGQSSAPRTNSVFIFGSSDGAPYFNIESGTRVNIYRDNLDSIPKSISTSIDIFNSDYTISSPTVSLVASDELTKLFFSMNASSKGKLNAAIDDSTSTISVLYGGALEAGDILYISDECMCISSVTSHVGNIWTLSVSRGDGWLGKSKAYTKGASVRVNSIPYMKLRRCKLEIFDNELGVNAATDADKEKCVVYTYLGIIDEANTNDDTSLIDIKTMDLMSVLLDIELPTFKSIVKPTHFANSDEGVFVLNSVIDPADNNNFENVEFAVAKKSNSVTIGSKWKTWRIGEAVYASSADVISNSYDLAQQNFLSYPTGDVCVFQKSLTNDEVKELSANEDRNYITQTISFNNGGDFIDQGFDSKMPWIAKNDAPGFLGYYPRNPIVIALILMMSTGEGTNNFVWNDGVNDVEMYTDCLSRSWGAGIDSTYFDLERWAKMIVKVGIEVEVQQLNLGYEGQFNLKETVKTLLRLADCYMISDRFGKISIGRLEPFSVIDILDNINFDKDEQNLIYLEPNRLKISMGGNNITATALVGGAPGIDPTNVTVSGVSGDRRDSNISTSEFVLDYNMLSRNEALKGKILPSFDVFRSLRNYRKMLFDSNPFLECICPIKYETQTGIPNLALESGKVPELGAWVVIRGNNEIIGPDGNRIVINDEENWVLFLGRIVGYTLNIPNMTYSIKVYLEHWKTGKLPKLVSPSARITSYDSGPSKLNLMVGKYEAFNGGSGFSVGDQIQIVDTFGRATSFMATGGNYRTITTSVGGGTPYVIMDAGLNVGALFSGMEYYIRLANFDDYTNLVAFAGVQYLPLDQRRVYAFLADAAERLSGDQDPDVWAM